MKLLAFDTSTQWLTVACANGTQWVERAELAGQAHSQRLLPLVDEVLGEAQLALGDLDGLAFGAGPGSFTGVRIACGVAQGLGLGAGLHLVPVSTLEALAESAWQSHGWTRVVACLDARMREVYVAGYRREDSRWVVERNAAVLRPDDIAGDSRASNGAGDHTGGSTTTGGDQFVGGDRGAGFESDASQVLGEVVDRSTIEGLLRASRSGDPAQRALAAKHARDAVAARLEQLKKQRAAIEARAKSLRH